MDAFVAPPLFEQQQHVQHNHVHATTANSTTTTKTHWALHPPLGEHGSSNNASPSSATSTNVQRGSQSPQKNCRTTTTTHVSPYKTSAPANDHHHRTYSSVLPAPTAFHPPNATPRTPPMHRQQQSPQHTSPRPTILRNFSVWKWMKIYIFILLKGVMVQYAGWWIGIDQLRFVATARNLMAMEWRGTVWKRGSPWRCLEVMNRQENGSENNILTAANWCPTNSGYEFFTEKF